MRITPLRLAALFAISFAATGEAGADTIYLLDGKSIDDVSIEEETIKKIIYKEGTKRSEVDNNDVFRVTYTGKSELVDRADTAAIDGQVLDAISDLEMYVEGQLASERRPRYRWELAYAMFRLIELHEIAGNAEKLIATADNLVKTRPDSRYVPEAILAKAETQYLTGQGKAATKTLDEFKAMIQVRGLSQRWAMEEKLRSALYDPGLKGKRLRTKLTQIASEAGGAFPQVKNAADVAAGESLLEEKKHAEAEPVFKRVTQNPKAGARTLAAAYTGYGDCLFRNAMSASPGESRDRLLNEAKMAYMRVVVVYKDQYRYVPKAMFWAGRVFDESQEENDKEAAQKLYKKLIRLYPDTKWETEARGFLKR